MAFTEGQLLAGGGMIANQPYSKPKTQAQQIQTPSQPTASYIQSVNSEAVNTLSARYSTLESQGINSNNAMSAVSLLNAFGSEIGVLNSDISASEASLKSLVSTTEQTNLQALKGYSGMNPSFYESYGFTPQTLNGMILVENGKINLKFNPLSIPTISGKFNRINSTINLENSFINDFNTLSRQVSGYSEEQANSLSSFLSAAPQNQTPQFLSFISNIVGAQNVSLAASTPTFSSATVKSVSKATGLSSNLVNDIATGSLVAGMTPASINQDIQTGNELAAAAKRNSDYLPYQKGYDLLNVLNEMVSGKEAVNLLTNKTSVSNIINTSKAAAQLDKNGAFLSELTTLGNKFGIISEKTSQKDFEEIGITAGAIAASVLSFGTLTPIAAGAIGGGLVTLGVSEATAGSIAALTAPVTIGALSSGIYGEVQAYGNAAIGNAMTPNQFK